jgi:hypothetical protein
MSLGLIKDGEKKKILGSGGGGGHKILNKIGTILTQRDKMRFKDAKVTDDSTNGETKVEVLSTVTKNEFNSLPTDGTADGVYAISDAASGYVAGASSISFSNTGTGMSATNVQNALSELNAEFAYETDTQTYTLPAVGDRVDVQKTLTKTGYTPIGIINVMSNTSKATSEGCIVNGKAFISVVNIANSSLAGQTRTAQWTTILKKN